jgi:hypothetical protein
VSNNLVDTLFTLVERIRQRLAELEPDGFFCGQVHRLTDAGVAALACGPFVDAETAEADQLHRFASGHALFKSSQQDVKNSSG